jgi:hypothetical protein
MENRIEKLESEIQNLKKLIGVLVDSITATEGKLSYYDEYRSPYSPKTSEENLLIKLSENLKENNIETEWF